MLLSLAELVPILQCPGSGSNLQSDPSGIMSQNGGEPYLAVRGKPVLVDFGKSLLNREQFLSSQGESVVTRTREAWWLPVYRAIVHPAPTITVGNILRLIELGRELSPTPRVLVVGGGTIGQGAEALYTRPDVGVASFDIYESPNVQFIADAHDLPIKDEVFDAVVIQAVMEHVLQPERVAAEIYRVLKPGGVVYAETPFMQQVHEGPYDFTRFTESGHRWLFRQFERVDSSVLTGPGIQLTWSLAYIARGLFRSKAAGRVVRVGFFWLRFLDLLIPKPFQVDGACGVFFLGVKRTPLVPKDIVKHYQGAG